MSQLFTAAEIDFDRCNAAVSVNFIVTEYSKINLFFYCSISLILEFIPSK